MKTLITFVPALCLAACCCAAEYPSFTRHLLG